MAVGDNFDTSTVGLENRRSGRIAGSFESSTSNFNDTRRLQENNYGHPCNIGCGCKEVCNGILGSCLLPPELTVTLTKSATSRIEAEFNIGQGTQGSAGSETYHLIYSNGVWRGRKCCFDDHTGGSAYGRSFASASGEVGEAFYFVRDEDAAKVYGKDDDEWESKYKLSGAFKFDREGKNIPAVGCVDSDGNSATLRSGATDKDSCIKNDYEWKEGFSGVFVDGNGEILHFNDLNGVLNSLNSALANEAVDVGGLRGYAAGVHLAGTSCDPCDVTTIDVGQGYISAERYCSYYGKEGTFRQGIKGNTTRPYSMKKDFQVARQSGQRTLKESGLKYTQIPIHPNAPPGCLPDGEKANPYPDYCWDTINNAQATKYVVKCFKDSPATPSAGAQLPSQGHPPSTAHIHLDEIEIHPELEYPEKERDCVAAGYRVVKEILPLTQNQCLDDAVCDSADAEESKYTKWECLANGLKWTRDWKLGTEATLDSQGNWLAGGYDQTSCCGGRVIDAVHTSHTPNMRSGLQGQKHASQGTCVTPYKEVILMPGRPESRTPGAPQFECNTGTNSSFDRYAFHSDLAMAGFTLVIRGCDFHNPYNATSSASSTTDAIGLKSGGQETVLYIPMDQIMNCSDFSLTRRSSNNYSINSKRQGWYHAYGDLAGNATGGVYPGDPHSTAGAIASMFGKGARGINYCMSPSDGPAYNKQDDEWAHDSGSSVKGHGSGGSNKFNSSDLEVSFRGGAGNKYSYGNCSIAWYWENNLKLHPHNARSFHAPGDWGLRKLNLQPQPFKATEWKQNQKKSLAQAKSDQKLFEECLNVQWPGWCNRTPLAFWFEHDINPDILERNALGQLRIDRGDAGVLVPRDPENPVLGGGYIVDQSGGSPCYQVGVEISSMLNVQYDQTCEDIACGGSCQFSFINTENETVNQTGACVCSRGRSQGVTGIDSSSVNCPAQKRDAGHSGEMFDCEFVEVEDFYETWTGASVLVKGNALRECVGTAHQYCTDDQYISQEGCLNAGGEWHSAIGVWQFPAIYGSGSDPGHTQCGGCGRGPKTAFYVLDTPPGLDAQERQDWQIKHADGINQKFPGAFNDDYSFINLPPQITSKFKGLYTSREAIYGQNSNRLDSLHYWGATGLWPDGEFTSFITDTFLALNTTRNVEYASHTTPVVIKSINHGLRDDDHIMTYGILGHFKANTWTAGEWQEQQWQDKLYTRCTSDGCGEPMWPNAVCPCNDGVCTDPSGFDQKSCEEMRYSWGKSCVIGGKSDNRWLDEQACIDSGECYQTDLGGGNRVRITDKIEIVPPPINEKNCNKLGEINSQTIKTEWVPYDGTDAPKAEWQGGCSNSNYSNEADCGAARPSWTYNNIYGVNNKNCSGYIIKGKFPPPADFFVTKWIDNDHVSLYTCNGEPLDGSITRGLDSDCDPVGPMACYDDRFTFMGIIDKCPCTSIDTEPRSVWGSDYDVPLIKRTSRISFDEQTNSAGQRVGNDEAESACREHGFCEILADAFGVMYNENTIMTRDDCESLAKFYSKITQDTDTKKFSYELLSGHLIDGDINGTLPKDHELAPCVTRDDKGRFNLAACWKPFDWSLKKNIIALQRGDIAGVVDSWQVCPSTGAWTIRDMNITNPLVSDPTTRSWRPYWTESYYKTDVGAEDNYISIKQDETCPVCCDHFMPETLTATIDGLPVNSNGRGGTEHLNYLVTGSQHIEFKDHANAYCEYCPELCGGSGPCYRVPNNPAQADCGTTGAASDKCYNWEVPINIKEVQCGVDSCTGKLHNWYETLHPDPRTNPMGVPFDFRPGSVPTYGRLGRVGGGWCCDCETEIKEGVALTKSCAVCHGALRFKPHGGTDAEWAATANYLGCQV